jgi:hypothetical protein
MLSNNGVKLLRKLELPLAFPKQHVQIIAVMLTKLSIGGVMGKLLVLGLLILIFTETSQTQSQSVFLEKAKHFNNYSEDFLGFMRNGVGDDREVDEARELADLAAINSERLSAADTLMEIYGKLSCPEDRERIRPVIQRDFSIYKKLFENSVASANLSLNYTHKPAVVAEGMKMRDELREIENLFNFNPRLE